MIHSSSTSRATRYWCCLFIVYDVSLTNFLHFIFCKNLFNFGPMVSFKITMYTPAHEKPWSTDVVQHYSAPMFIQMLTLTLGDHPQQAADRYGSLCERGIDARRRTSFNSCSFEGQSIVIIC